MTRKRSPGGVPDADVAAYYRRRAKGGVGLILTEGVAVGHPAAVYDSAIPRFHGEDALAGWAQVLAAVRAEGGRIMPQLWHVGAFRKLGDGPNPDIPPVAPSGLYDPHTRVSEPMTQRDIDAVLQAYGNTASAAHRLGFDGIEIHAAHGYLIDQFFWEGTNQRDDRYNGDMVARTHFAVEVVAACRAATDAEFPISLRLSQWKQQDYNVRLATTPHALALFLAPMVDAGVDILHCSARRFWEPEFEGSDMNLAGWAKKLTGLPTITVGSVGLDIDTLATFGGETAGVSDIGRLQIMLARGDFDLVAVGRALLGDPEWAAKTQAGREHELLPFAPNALKEFA